MHPQSCIIEEVQEEGTSCASHSPEHAAGSTAAAGVPSTGHTSSGSDPQVAESSSQPDAADAAAASTEAETSILQPSEAAAEASSNAEQPVDAELQQLLVDCDRLKQEGNAAYARGEYDEALQLYWQVRRQDLTSLQLASVGMHGPSWHTCSCCCIPVGTASMRTVSIAGVLCCRKVHKALRILVADRQSSNMQMQAAAAYLPVSCKGVHPSFASLCAPQKVFAVAFLWPALFCMASCRL